jgi:hypothetical protein
VLTLPSFFLVLPGLVQRLLWDTLVCALRVPIRLPRIVWISSGCASAVIWRLSRSLQGFSVSLPVAWSPPTLIRYKVSYPLFFSKFNLLLSLVHTASIVAVLETFSLALFSAASARGQWKSSFPLAVILEPPVEMLFSLAVL